MENRPVPLNAGNPGPLTGAGNNTWLLDGREPTLIDAGVGAADHLEAIARHLSGRALVRVLVTHGHSDHAAGVPALKSRWPSLDVCRWSPGESDASTRLVDGQRVRAGEIELLVVHTPGHAPDHVCFFDDQSADLYSGDMLVQGTTVMIPAGRGGDLRAYLASLERLAAMKPARALPGHGPIIERPVELIAEYIEHRRQREQQVLACLADGLTTVDDIVARIYPDLNVAVQPAARMTVEAHLEKLNQESRR